MLYRILLIAAIGATLLLAGCPKGDSGAAAGGAAPAGENNGTEGDAAGGS
jgi:hypothetical protein